MIGREYLSAALKRLTGGLPLNIELHGDSRLAGNALLTADYQAPTLIQRHFRAAGVIGVTVLNHAVSGTCVSAMSVNASAPPHLAIVCYGCNDAVLGWPSTSLSDRREAYRTALNAKLAAIRGVCGLDQLAIVLLAPPPAYAPNGQWEGWFGPDLEAVHLEAAVTHRCAYVEAPVTDAASLLGTLMDSVNGEAVHFSNEGNALWFGVVMQGLFPRAMLELLPNRTVALPLYNGWANYGEPHTDIGARLNDGVVTLRGVIRNPTLLSANTAWQLVAVLPQEMWPKGRAVVRVHLNDLTKIGALAIWDNGLIVAQTALDSALTSLDGACFAVA